MAERPSLTTIDQKVVALSQNMIDFKENTSNTLEEIKQQTIKTNGRVNRHDTDIAILGEKVDQVLGAIKSSNDALKAHILECPVKKQYDVNNNVSEVDKKKFSWEKTGIVVSSLLSVIAIIVSITIIIAK